MPREIIQGDIEVAQKLLFAHRDAAQVTAALVYRGLDEQTATRLVEDLKSRRRVTVQPAETQNARRESPRFVPATESLSTPVPSTGPSGDNAGSGAVVAKAMGAASLMAAATAFAAFKSGGLAAGVVLGALMWLIVFAVAYALFNKLSTGNISVPTKVTFLGTVLLAFAQLILLTCVVGALLVANRLKFVGANPFILLDSANLVSANPLILLAVLGVLFGPGILMLAVAYPVGLIFGAFDVRTQQDALFWLPQKLRDLMTHWTVAGLLSLLPFFAIAGSARFIPGLRFIAGLFGLNI